MSDFEILVETLLDQQSASEFFCAQGQFKNNFRGQTWTSQTLQNLDKNFFLDISVVNTIQEAKLASKFKSTHILCPKTESLGIDLFEQKPIHSKDHSYQHWKRLSQECRMALVRAVFSSQGRLCDTIDISQDPELPSFLFTDRPDLVPSKIRQTINVIQVPNYFGVPQIAAKHVKWMTHFYLPTQDTILWVDGFMCPDNSKPWASYMKSLFSLSLSDDSAFCVSTRKQTYQRLNVYSENDECLRCKRISKESHLQADKYLRELGIAKELPMQIYWTSILVKANRHAHTIKICEELFSLIQNVHQRDQVFLPVVLAKQKTSPILVLPQHCDKVLGRHNVEI